MKVTVVSVGRPRGALAEGIAEYESRFRHYFPFETVEVREESGRGGVDADRVRAEEGKRLLGRVPDGSVMVAMHRTGARWSSERLSGFLGELAVQGRSGGTFLIGGAFGLSDEVLGQADHLLSLSCFTLPHELARLVLTEQLYRAGTILRGEPYHKTRASRRQ